MCKHDITALVQGIYADPEVPAIRGAWLGEQCLVCGMVLDRDPDADTLTAWLLGQLDVPHVDQAAWDGATDMVVADIQRTVLGNRQQEVGQLLARRNSVSRRHHV